VATRLRPLGAAVWFVLAGLLVAGCRGSPSALDPRGPAAERLAALSWALFGLLGVITVAVLGVLALALFRGRGEAPEQEAQLRIERRLIVGGGIVLPAVTAVVLMALNIGAGAAVTGHSGRPAGIGLGSAVEPEIEVIGHRFWWEIRYPEQGFVSANELHLPVGRRVPIALRSIDVIHSFWVPQLHGKIDLTPGHETYLVLEASRAGVFRGMCAEYCGVQHALMGFLVIAQPEEEYEAWLEQQARPAAAPRTERAELGRQVFMDAGCAACHAIAGTEADGRLGPDLTHFGSRRTIGAATVPNTRGHLGGWIVDSQTIKPGNLMPPQRVGSEELLGLLDYLEGLR
jgi:cytochrome c oxidase subunit II